ncbi:hypothetical protein [Roseivivax sp. CAU 1761]
MEKVAEGADEIAATYPDPEIVAALGAHRQVNLPLRVGGRAVGLLNLAQGAGQDWSRLQPVLPQAAALAGALVAGCGAGPQR